MSVNPKHNNKDATVQAFVALLNPHNADLPHLRAGCWDKIQDRYLEKDCHLPPLYLSDRFGEDWGVLMRYYDELLDELAASRWGFGECVLWAYRTILSYPHEGRRLMRHKRMREALLEYGG